MLSSPARQGPGSRRIFISYVLDWIVIVLIAVLAGAITYIKPNRRPFSLVDPQISFPYVPKEKVSIGTLFGVALAAPAVLIVLIALLVVPSTKLSAQGFRSHRWTRKLWEWNAGWLGLALSFAVTALLTNGLKILLGKPRPDMLAICKPDLANAAAHILGGIDDQISEGTLVSSTICRPSDAKALKDAFQSFPSGHASFSFAGLLYFALFLCAKFAVRIPYLLPYSFEAAHPSSSATFSSGHMNESSKASDDHLVAEGLARESKHHGVEYRDQAAAPPTHGILLPLVPICLALYICTTRYSDFKHHGFDIIAGAIIGAVVAWLSFRLYHLPIGRGAGWAWGPRGATRAFGVRVGTLNYADIEGHRRMHGGLEAGMNGREMAVPTTTVGGR